MITFEKTEGRGFDPHVIYFDEEDRARLLNILKRGSNTLSPPDMEIIKLIGEMEIK